jgi:hypothetical protein
MNEVVVLASVSANPRNSTRQMARETGLSQSTVDRTLRKNKYRLLKTHKNQELRPGDAERRLEFAMSALEMIDEDPDFVRKIIFTDESSFTLHHAPNWCRILDIERKKIRTMFMPLAHNIWGRLMFGQGFCINT